MSLHIQITNVQQRTVNKKIHNFYTIKTTQNNIQIGASQKRYSQFRDLHKSLSDNRSLLQGQGEKISKIPAWTNIGALFSNKLSQQSLEKRRIALEKWLNDVSNKNVARSFEDYRKFLKLTKVRIFRGFAQWANFYGGILKVDPKTKKVKLVKIDPNALLSKSASNSSFTRVSDSNIKTPSPGKQRNINHKEGNSSTVKQFPLSGILTSRTVEDIKKINFGASNQDFSTIQKQQNFQNQEDKTFNQLKANLQNLQLNAKKQEQKSEEREFVQNYQRNDQSNHISAQNQLQNGGRKQSNTDKQIEDQQQKQKSRQQYQSKEQQYKQQLGFDQKLFASIGANHHGRNISGNSFGEIKSEINGGNLSAMLDYNDLDQSGHDRSIIIDFSDMAASQHRFGKSFTKYDSQTQQQIQVFEQGSGINTSFQLKSARYFGMDFD